MSRRFEKQYAGNGVLVDRAYGIFLDWGPTLPADGTKGYAVGAEFFLTAQTGATTKYRNNGSLTSSLFQQGSGGVDLTGLTATAAEINRNNTTSAREILAGATLTVTQALHDGKTIAMPAACAVTLPASTGSGSRFKFYQKIAATAVTITATAADMYGNAWLVSDNSAAVLGYVAAGSTIITFDGSTKGGLKGAIVEIEDVATNLLLVRVMSAATGTEATPFS